jgi:uncharacterized repeat protein (TIGR02543 family)
MEISENITSIGVSAFAACSNLANVYFASETPPAVGLDAFQMLPDGAKAIVPNGAAAYGNESDLWHGLIVTYADKTEHDYTHTITAPTCESKGFTTHACAHCGDVYTDGEVPALGHDFAELIGHKDATSEESGYDIWRCSRCLETKTVVIPVITEYANMNGLLAALEKAAPYMADQAKYSKATFDALEKAVEKGLALTAAYIVSPLPKEFQSEIDAAEKAVNDAIENLKNKSLLENIVANITVRIQNYRDRIEKLIPQVRERINQIMTATVTFDVDGNITTEKIYRGTAVAQPAAPVKEGYTFIGWRVGSPSGAAYNFGNPIYRNVTLYAAWETVISYK